MIIREERPDDAQAVRLVNEAAFRRPDEADLVRNLHSEGVVLCSLIAEVPGSIIGHILFTRMWIDQAAGSIPAVALAPMAVLPEHQRKGIGGRLIRDGLDRLRQLRERIVLVLGHPDYYSRFGFSTEKAHLLITPFPPEAFMAMELDAGAPAGLKGKVRYPRAFGI